MSESKTTKPNPGSDAAIAQGCMCPVLDNGHGKGNGSGDFWINDGCPIHAPKSCGIILDETGECESCQ